MFLDSDAWLLLSLIYAPEACNHHQLRAVGDYINHAIFTDEEIDGGLARLVQAGYVTEVSDRYFPTEHVRDWYASITEGKSQTAVQKDLERVKQFLHIENTS